MARDGPFLPREGVAWRAVAWRGALCLCVFLRCASVQVGACVQATLRPATCTNIERAS
jgi:hypothetical protein